MSAGLDPAFPRHYFRPSSKAFLSLLAKVDASFVALPATLAVFSRAVGACRCAARTPRISVRHTQRQTANTRYRKTTVITPFTAALATLHSASDICCDPLCITFEVSWRQRQDARPEPQKMYTVPVARAWWPAVGAQLDRGVRRHLALPVLCCSDELPKALAPDNNSAVLGWFDAARNGDHEILEGLYVAYSNHLLLQAVEV